MRDSRWRAHDPGTLAGALVVPAAAASPAQARQLLRVTAAALACTPPLPALAPAVMVLTLGRVAAG